MAGYDYTREFTDYTKQCQVPVNQQSSPFEVREDSYTMEQKTTKIQLNQYGVAMIVIGVLRHAESKSGLSFWASSAS